MEIGHDGKVALVTGGTGALGTALCRQLADSGARVATCFRNQSKADAWLQENGGKGYDFAAIPADVSDFDSCRRLAEAVRQRLGPAQLLVNNAGIAMDASLRKMSEDQWRRVLSINLDSVFAVSRQFLPDMLESGFGRIVNISSINGQRGQRGQCNYSAAKAGMHGFTMALAREVAGKGITVNTVSPGYLDSEMVMQVPEKFREQIRREIPVGRFGAVEEIACLVDFLVSDKSGFITGANLAANGGHHIG